MTDSNSKQSPIFDYLALRLLVGVVAFSMPLFAKFNSSTPISSISGSYHTGNRDIFVGLTFVIGALLWAYNGHDSTQKVVSKLASIAAIITAIFPTACYDCESDLNSNIHYGAAVFLFLTIAYFCLGPFRTSAKGKRGIESQRRATIYLICGGIILASLLFAFAALFIWSSTERKVLAITYYVEWVSLWAFGIAWFVASKLFFPIFANEDERLKILPRNQA
jgi:hypothetical protein